MGPEVASHGDRADRACSADRGAPGRTMSTRAYIILAALTGAVIVIAFAVQVVVSRH